MAVDPVRTYPCAGWLRPAVALAAALVLALSTVATATADDASPTPDPSPAATPQGRATPQAAAAVLGTATGPISLAGGRPTPTWRDREFPASSMVAQMYADTVGGGNPEVIGIQEPGGIRAGLDAGEITSEETALLLPNGYSVVMLQLTPSQLKSVLEQQWQSDPFGTPIFPYQRLGFSSNFTYTYDESRPAGSRIISMTLNGRVMENKPYTIATNSYLADGNENFRAMRSTTTSDTGLGDLFALDNWITSRGSISPRYAMSGTQAWGVRQPAVANTTFSFNLGMIPNFSIAPDTLNNSGTGAPQASLITMQLTQNSTVVDLNTRPVSNGGAGILAEITTVGGLVSGSAMLVMRVDNGTVVHLPVTLQMPTTTRHVWGDQTGDGSGDVFAIGNDGALHLFGSRAGHQVVGRGWGGFTWIGHTPDVTGDGIDDLLARRSDGNLYLYPSAGGYGRLGSARLVGRGWGGFNSLSVVGNQTGDAHPELVGVHADGRLMRYTLTPSAVTTMTTIGRNWGSMTSILGIGSFNYTQDTTRDVVAVRSDGAVFAYLVNSSGGLGSAMQVTDAAGKPVNLSGARTVIAMGGVFGDAAGTSGATNSLVAIGAGVTPYSISTDRRLVVGHGFDPGQFAMTDFRLFG